MSKYQTLLQALTLLFLLGWSRNAIAQSIAMTPPAVAPGSVQLYEATENMKLIARGHPHRTAMSELIGVTGKADTNPLCNDVLLATAAALLADLQAVYPAIVPLVPSTISQCTINATGVDNVDLVTGVGPIHGTFSVVVQGDNPTDAPEFVVTQARFEGTIDFAPLAWYGYGTAEGTIRMPHHQRVPFRGTFRIPLGAASNAVYVSLSGGTPAFVPVQPGEYAGGWPMVRFDLQLEE